MALARRSRSPAPSLGRVSWSATSTAMPPPPWRSATRKSLPAPRAPARGRRDRLDRDGRRQSQRGRMVLSRRRARHDPPPPGQHRRVFLGACRDRVAERLRLRVHESGARRLRPQRREGGGGPSGAGQPDRARGDRHAAIPRRQRGRGRRALAMFLLSDAATMTGSLLSRDYFFPARDDHEPA